MHAADKFAIAISQITELLQSEEVKTSKVPLGEYNERYKKLKAIRSFFGVPWDDIEKQIKASEYPEEWIWESRQDEPFKKYYKLRMEADKMEVLVK